MVERKECGRLGLRVKRRKIGENRDIDMECVCFEPLGGCFHII